eukprot:1963998-Rhodomonas_salina.1
MYRDLPHLQPPTPVPTRVPGYPGTAPVTFSGRCSSPARVRGYAAQYRRLAQRGHLIATNCQPQGERADSARFRLDAGAGVACPRQLSCGWADNSRMRSERRSDSESDSHAQPLTDPPPGPSPSEWASEALRHASPSCVFVLSRQMPGPKSSTFTATFQRLRGR